MGLKGISSSERWDWRRISSIERLDGLEEDF